MTLAARRPIGYIKRPFMSKESLRVVLLMELAMDCKEVRCFAVCGEYFQLMLYRKEWRFGKSLLSAYRAVLEVLVRGGGGRRSVIWYDFRGAGSGVRSMGWAFAMIGRIQAV